MVTNWWLFTQSWIYHYPRDGIIKQHHHPPIWTCFFILNRYQPVINHYEPLLFSDKPLWTIYIHSPFPFGKKSPGARRRERVTALGKISIQRPTPCPRHRINAGKKHQQGVPWCAICWMLLLGGHEATSAPKWSAKHFFGVQLLKPVECWPEVNVDQKWVGHHPQCRVRDGNLLFDDVASQAYGK